MALMLKDLEALLEESNQFASASSSEISELLSWGAWREAIFERLRKADFELHRSEESRAIELIRKILELDAAIIARLEKQLGVLEQEIIGTNKMRQLLHVQSVRKSAVLLNSVA
jgi:hypothetical protein